MVADRYCYGSFPGRQEIVLTDGEDALTQVCRWYLQHTECPRQSALHRVQYRNDHVAQLVHNFKADGAIYEQMKFCTYWSYERVIANQIMPRDYGIHILSIDRPYIAGRAASCARACRPLWRVWNEAKLRSAQKGGQLTWPTTPKPARASAASIPPSTAPSAPANGAASETPFMISSAGCISTASWPQKLGCHPILMVKAMLRYRWMVSYLTAAHMVDRHTMGLRGKELRYAHNQFFLRAA